MSKVLSVVRDLKSRAGVRAVVLFASVVGAVALSPMADAAGGLGVGLGAGITTDAASFKTTMVTVIGGLIAGIIIVALGILGFRWAVSLSKGR